MRALTQWAGLGLATLGIGATVAIASTSGSAQARGTDDVANVTAVLDAMRGTAPIPCGLALSLMEGNGWGNRSPGHAADADLAVERIRDWLEHPITDPAVVPLLRTALALGDDCVRQVAARLLGRTRHPRAVSALADALRDPDATTRALAALGLGLADGPVVFEPLVGALHDSDAPVRANAALALGHLGDHRAMPSLVPLLKNDRAPSVRQAAALALGELD